MRKLFILLLLLALIDKPIWGQESNVTLLGRWGKGKSEAVFRRGGYTITGNGAYLELYRTRFNIEAQRVQYDKLDSLLLPGPVKDIWMQSDLTHIYVACGVKGLQVVYLDNVNHQFVMIIGDRDTQGHASAVMQYQNFAYVADGENGLVVMDVGFPSNPQIISNLPLSGYARDVWILNNNTALIAAGSQGLFSIDISNPNNPTFLDSVEFESAFPWIPNLPPPTAHHILSIDTVVYVAAGYGGMHMVDVRNPADLQKLGRWIDTVPVNVRDVWVTNNKAFIAGAEKGIYGLIDVSDPNDPGIAPFSLNTDGIATNLVIEQDTAYVADGFNGHLLMQVGAQAQFTVLDSSEAADVTMDAAVSGGYLFAATGKSGVKVLNATVTNPPNDFQNELDSYQTRGEARRIVKNGSWLYVADGSWGLTILDALNPMALSFRDEFITSGDTCYDVDVTSTYAFLACGTNGMRIINISYSVFEVPGSPFNTQVLGRAKALRIVNDDIYLATTNGIYVYDISQLPVGITLRNSMTIGDFDPHDIKIADNTVFLANGRYGFLLWNMSTGVVNRVDPQGMYTGIAIKEKTLFVTDAQFGLRIFDFSVPDVFSQVGQYATGAAPMGLSMSGDNIYLADSEDGVYFLQSEIRPKIAIMPTNLNFGIVPPEHSRPLNLWITNPGTTVLEVTNILSNRTEYQFSETSFQVVPGDTHKVIARFEPTILTPVGVAIPALASIQSNADTLNITLQGQVRALHGELPYVNDTFTIALWHFDEADGNNAVLDASLNNLDGTLLGGPTRITSKSGFGRAIDFDGVDDRVVIPPSPFLNFPNGPFTVELWFFMKQKPGTYYILLRGGDDVTRQYELALGATEGVIGSAWDSFGGQRTLMTGSMGELNLNQWYHVAFTWDGDSLRLSLNSKLRDGMPFRGQLRPSTGLLNIGSNAGLNAPFRGSIDEVRISQIARQDWEFHVNQSKLSISEQFIDFGAVLRGYSRRLPLIIGNIGGQTLNVTHISTDAPNVQVTQTDGFTLAVGQERTVWLTYTPGADDSLDEGSRLSIESSDPTYPTFELPLMGNGIVAPTAGTYGPDPFTLALYHFDETSGDPRVIDASGNSIHGSWDGINRPSGKFDTELTIDRALLFSEGQNFMCTITPGPEHFIGPNRGGFTVEGWFYPENLPAVKGTLVRRVSNPSQFDVSVDSSGAIVGVLFNDQMQPFTVTSHSAQAIQFRQWYHVAMTLDQDTLRLYLNGDEVDFAYFPGPMAGQTRGTPVDTLSLQIGRDWEDMYPYYGRVDEVRISGIGRQPWEFNVIGARVAVSNDSLNFGKVFLSDERQLKVWVKNPGIDSLHVADIFTSNPSLFTIDLNSFSLAPGDSQLVRVTYRPLNTAVHGAQLSLETNDPFWPLRPIYLRGEGTTTLSTGPYVTDLFTQALYHFDENVDTTLADSSGMQLNGELNGAVNWSDTSRYGGSLRFDGTDGWVRVPYHPSLDFINRDFTMELWFSLIEKPVDHAVLLRRGTNFTKQFELGVSAVDGIVGSVWDSEGQQHSVMTGSPDTLLLNQWIHVAFSWDGDSLRLKINNVVWDRRAFRGILRSVSQEPLRIGTLQYPFNGFMDEMRISNVLRKSWEISVLPPKILISQSQIDFALVLVDSSRTFSFQVSNAGDQDLVITRINGIGGVFSVPESLTSFVVPGFASQTVPVTYTPNIGNRTDHGSLTINSNDVTNSTIIVALVGSSREWSGVQPLPLDSHTSLLYHFNRNEILGDSIVVDISDNGLNGYMRNGTAWTENGFFGGGLYFDGTDDRVQIPFDDKIAFDMTSEDFTIEYYFRTDTLSQTLLSLGFNDPDHAINYAIGFDHQGRIVLEGFGAGGSSFNDNSWHHMVFTYDHQIRTGRLYVDGVPIWSRLWARTTWDAVDRPLIIGAAERFPNAYFSQFEGYIDELRISTIIRQPWEYQLFDWGIRVAAMNPNPPVLGQPLTMDIRVPGGLAATEVSVLYRLGGRETYEILFGVQIDPATYQVVIPADFVTLQGIEYYVEVITANDTLVYPGLDPQNDPVSSTIRHTGMDASVELEYRRFSIFSIPFDLDSTDVASVLEDDFGPWNPYKWRLFWWHRLDSVYVDYTDSTAHFFDFVPGRSYWIVSDVNQVFDIGSGQTVSTDSGYQIQINPGWNMIGLPYYFTIGWDDCTLSSDSIGTLYYYDKTDGYRIDWPTLDPWKGYWIYNADFDNHTLSVNPKQSVLAKRSGVRKGVLTNLQKDEWMFKISVETEFAKDLDNFAGVRFDAKDEWDLRDRPEPPPIGNYISSYFENMDWTSRSGHYAADIRGPGQSGYVWEFVVDNQSTKTDVSLSWILHQGLPDDWKAYLLDMKDGIAKDMLSMHHMNYVDEPASSSQRRFRLVVGTDAFIQNNSEGIPLKPVEFNLFQNFPNPFNPETTIRYSLPKNETVEIVIFNALGQRVRSLLEGAKKAGYHEVLWDGRDDHGRSVSSGIYFCRLQASERVTTRKMIVLR